MADTPQFMMVEEAPKRGLGVVYMVIAVFLWLVGLLSLPGGVNAVAYRLGASTPVEVTVSRTSEAGFGPVTGVGYYEHGDETLEVLLDYVTKGETVVAGLPVVPIPVIADESYADDSTANEDMYTSFALVAFGIAAVRLFKRGRGHYTGAVRVTRRYFRDDRSGD